MQGAAKIIKPLQKALKTGQLANCRQLEGRPLDKLSLLVAQLHIQ
jgi:hypothetical protein